MRISQKYFFVFLLIGQSMLAKDYHVKNIAEFDSSVSLLQPGDKIILKNGQWKDVNFEFKGRGTENACIFLTAETPGQVIITGNSSLKMAGEFLEVNGLWFKDGYSTEKAVISFRVNSKNFANNSRVTNCAITDFNPEDKEDKYSYLDLWGRNNRVDHNYFKGKTNSGPTLIVWLGAEEHRKNHHQIDHNLFGERLPLGKNGGETIRIGTSTNSMYSSGTIVEKNRFEKCNGEAEIISNKSGDNQFKHNLFVESQGSLTLRHGNNALVEGNVFLGKRKSLTGGVRIINENHVVRNNLFIGLRGEELKAPLVIMNGVPDSPLNRYHQVKKADVQFNTFIDCSPLQIGAGKDKERSLPPINSVVANNLFLKMSRDSIMEAHDVLAGINFQNNIVDARGKNSFSGFKNLKVKKVRENKIPIPIETATLKAVKIGDNTPLTDASETVRENLYVGAIDPGNGALPVALQLNVGTNWKNDK